MDQVVDRQLNSETEIPDFMTNGIYLVQVLTSEGNILKKLNVIR